MTPPVTWIHWTTILSIARESHENGAVLDGPDGHRRYFPHSLVVIVFSALAVEAYINELGELASFAHVSVKHERPVRDLGTVLTEIEKAQGSIELKYLMASRVLTGSAFDRSGQPYQDFRDLMR